MELDHFWQRRLSDGRERVSWEKVLQLSVVNRLIDPGSELRVHRQWFLQSAMDELLDVDFAVAEKDRLYRCLDRLLEHKQDLFVWLRQKWADLFQADFEGLLYDLTSTYFGRRYGREPEGQARLQPRWPSGLFAGRDCPGRDHRRIPAGLPSDERQDVGPHHASWLSREDRNHLWQARRMGVMDRGIPTEAVLAEMRDPSRSVSYLVGTPKGKISQHEKKWPDLPWQKVRDSVEVKLFEQDGE